MNTSIDDLLGEIDKFKKNLVNSNELVTALKETIDHMEKSEAKSREDNAAIMKRIEDFDRKLQLEHETILSRHENATNSIIRESKTRAFFNYVVFAGLGIFILVSMIFLILLLNK
jgi:hypothetical protein